MEINKKFGVIPEKKIVEKTISSLKEKGVNVIMADTGDEARVKALELLPSGAEVMNMTSTTLIQAGIEKELLESGRYDAVRTRLTIMDKNKRAMEKKRLGAAHDWVIGSIHALTESGEMLIASNTGSQMASYVFGASNVIFVVGTQKIVKDISEGMKRLYEYCLPLENERAMKAYGGPSAVNKILIINKEVEPGRINVILVNKKLGF